MKAKIKEYFFINLGLFLVAFEIHFIMIPNKLVAGGVSGFAIVANYFFPLLSVGTIMIILNLFLFVVGFIFIGFEFGAKTIYSSFALSGLVWILQKFCPIKTPFTDDILAQLILAMCISALGMAIVFNQNASTGGTDIIAKILNKYFNIDIGRAILISDLLIVLSSIIIFGIKVGIYGILGLIINSFIIDYMMQNFNINKETVVISQYSELIKKYIVVELNRGATVYAAKGAYTNDEREVIRTILRKNEFIKLKKYINSIDKNAFITVNNINETFGHGFIGIE